MRPAAVLFALLACAGCSSAAFDLAGDGPDADADDAELEASSDVAGDDSRHDVVVDSSPAESRDAGDTAPATDSSPATDAPIDSITTEVETDTGCPLFSHHDPMYGSSWSSCLHAGVPGDGSTYSAALFDDELAHVDAATPSGCSWGPRSSIACGTETCTARSYVCPAIFTGTAWATWCSTGSSAGWFIGANPTLLCPTTDAHANWY
jgi:hypothetical protein